MYRMDFRRPSADLRGQRKGRLGGAPEIAGHGRARPTRAFSTCQLLMGRPGGRGGLIWYVYAGPWGECPARRASKAPTDPQGLAVLSPDSDESLGHKKLQIGHSFKYLSTIVYLCPHLYGRLKHHIKCDGQFFFVSPMKAWR